MMDRREGSRSRAKPRSQAWPWIIVAAICMLGFVLVFRALLARTEWSAGPAPATRPQPAGASQPGHPASVVAHVLAADAAALSGNEAATREQFQAAHQALMREMKVPDGSRRIDPESARAALRTLPGVRSSAWADRENLIVMVEDAIHRSDAMIDAVCRQLDPLGDTLAVVVHLENVAASNADELQTISRNCQLAPGDRAFMQSNRSLDVVPESARRQHKAFDRQVKQGGTAKQDKAAVDALMKNTPEM